MLSAAKHLSRLLGNTIMLFLKISFYEAYRQHNYYIYMLTNYTKKILYIGITNDLERRLEEHKIDTQTIKKTFVGRYNCCYLIYWERHQYIADAIRREKELKGGHALKKEKVIDEFNPKWKFLNEDWYP